MYAGETQDHECVSKGIADPWGCHSDNVKGRWAIPCYTCLGSGCPTCSESGVIKMSQCPNRATTKALKEMGDLFRAHRWLDENSIFPINGGLNEQTAFFIHASEFITSYAKIYRKKKQDAKARIAKIKKKS
jgi:hypothetical protein